MPHQLRPDAASATRRARRPQRVLLTGGAGFMGSSVARALVDAGHEVVVLDALTYAGRREHLQGVAVELVVGDVADPLCVQPLVDAADLVVHMAAESHVDRSVRDTRPFVRTNIDGTRVVLETCQMSGNKPIYHVSTDEVFGSAPAGVFFGERDPLRPGNPYAATKAAAECLIEAWRHTFGLDTRIIRCTNNYGRRQHPEKALVGWIQRALRGEALPVHGEGAAVRDWLHVDDFAAAILAILDYEGERRTFHLAGRNPRTNLEMAELIRSLIGSGRLVFVPDRPGQDARYALDDAHTRADLGWAPRVPLADGLRELIDSMRRR